MGGSHHLSFEGIAVAAASATSHRYLSLLSVHVSTCLLVDTMLLKNATLDLWDSLGAYDFACFLDIQAQSAN